MTTHTNEKNMDGKGSYAEVNGLDMYYEIHGTGKPLILLLGGLMTIGMMGQILPDLARTRQVIAVEVQGHGHTADIDRPLTYEQVADDIAALIKHLGLERADVFGFSSGGGIALQTLLAVARRLGGVCAVLRRGARAGRCLGPNLYSSRRSGCSSHALRRRLSPGCGPPHGRSTGLAKKRAGEPSLALAGAVRASAVAQAQRHQATLVAAARTLARERR